MNYQADPEGRSSFDFLLETLTFNSKPIITSLTILAQENLQAGLGGNVVQSLEEHLKRASPAQKLPVLYLLDSISKNVGGMYITLFSHNLLNTFLDAYEVVDDATKQKFERVLTTWKVGPNGDPVYPPDVTLPIERTLSKQQMRYQSRGSDSGRTHIHINPNFLAGMQNQNALSSYQQGQQAPSIVSQTPQVSQPQNQWVEGSRYTNGASSYPTTTPSRQGYYSTQPYGSEAPPVAQLPLQQQNPAVFVPSPDQARLIQEYRALLLQRQQYAQNTADPNNQSQILALQQILDIIQVTMLTPDQIQTFHQQIATYMSPSAAPYQNLPAAIGSLTLQNTTDLNTLIAQHPTVLNGPPPPNTTSTFPAAATPIIQQQSVTSTVSSAPAQPPVAPVVTDTNELFYNLRKFGLLGPAANINVGAVPVKGGTPPPNAATSVVPSVNDLGRFELTSSDIQRRRDGAISILYDAYPRQCKQCGFRYAKTDEGKAKMDAHLDWHFRQNRRMKDKAKKAQSRSWFVSEEDWIHSRETDSTNAQSPAFFDFDTGASAKSVANTSQQKDAEVKESTVIVPLDWEKISKPCPICQEKFKKFYSDADDEWIFKNAVEVDGIIYHASCYADVVKNQESAQSSRESTPPSVLGKRKVEELQTEDLEAQKRPPLVS